ncbi:CpaE family protein [Nocardioides sp. GCM10027113]|uniref:AAA family ATPase n=1 Tax=unclassified Nocardioides TaxID=2615069 RepID=UPI00361CBC3E
MDASAVVVLVAAAGAGWESRALALLGERPGVVVLKRCVDVEDLMAAATAGQADVAVVAVDAPGLDAAAVDHLRAHGVRPVAVVPGGPGLDAGALRATRVGVRAVVEEDRLDDLPAVVAAGGEPDATAVRGPVPRDGEPGGGPTHLTDDGAAADDRPPARVVAVWGPGGAPGRTTVAVGIAAELARRGLRTLLVDADPYGGAVAPQLGILDEVSGVLSAARRAAAGELADRFGGVPRSLGQHLAVVTGLPRADRWPEVRPGVLEHLLDVGRSHPRLGGQVVVDTGFNLEHDPAADLGARPGRNHMTRAAIEAADEVVVVGSADPVGLSRLARGLVELRELTSAAPVRVVVNRMRPTIGWAEKDIAGMVEGFTRLTGLHFLPDDRAAVDRALVAGRTVLEVGDSALGRGLATLVDALQPAAPPPAPTGAAGAAGAAGPAGARGRLRRRTAGTARPR